MRHIFSRSAILTGDPDTMERPYVSAHARRLIQIPVGAQRDLEAFRLFTADADMILVADASAMIWPDPSSPEDSGEKWLTTIQCFESTETFVEPPPISTIIAP